MIRSFLRIYSHLLNKFLMGNFCAIQSTRTRERSYIYKYSLKIQIRLEKNWAITIRLYIVGNKAKGWISTRVLKESKARQIFVFLKHPFWDSPFWLNTDNIPWWKLFLKSLNLRMFFRGILKTFLNI